MHLSAATVAIITSCFRGGKWRGEAEGQASPRYGTRCLQLLQGRNMKTRLGELVNVPYFKAQIQVKLRERKHGPERFTAHQINVYMPCIMERYSKWLIHV